MHHSLRSALCLLVSLLALPVFAAFSPQADGTVTDTTTGLVWDRCAWGWTWNSGTNACDAGGAETFVWSGALASAVAANAARHRGYEDWRLPNKNELESLVNIDATASPAIAPVFPWPYAGGEFWSSTTYVSAPASAWRVDFLDGAATSSAKGSLFRVRLVRGGQNFQANFDAADVAAPVLSGVGVSGTTQVATTLGATSNEAASGYWMVVARNATAPSSAQVKGGSNYGAVTVVAHGSGGMAAGVAASFAVSGLSAGTSYDLYMVAEDASLNLIASPTRVQFATLPVTHTVAASASTGGTASCSPNPVNHGSSSLCTATANAGYTFSGWGGDCVGTSLTCTLNNVSSDKAVTASFVVTGIGEVTPPVPTPTIPLLGMPASCELHVRPAIVDMTNGVGPGFATDMMAMLSSAVHERLTYLEQTVCGAVVLGGYNGGKLALIPHTFQTGDTRANGIYPLGDGRYQVVRSGQTLTIAPTLVHAEQLLAVLSGASAVQWNNGVLVATLNGLTYAVQPGVVVQQNPAAGAAQLVMGGDGNWHFIDALGNNQILYPAFADPAMLRSALQSLDSSATLDIQLDGTASIVLNGQRYTLVPDITLSSLPTEGVSKSWWQENAQRFWVANAQPLGTAQGFTVRP